jgi:hypothetical protein
MKMVTRSQSGSKISIGSRKRDRKMEVEVERRKLKWKVKVKNIEVSRTMWKLEGEMAVGSEGGRRNQETEVTRN